METNVLNRSVSTACRQGLLMNAAYNNTDIRGRIRTDESMAGHTSWRTGGRAAVYFEPADLEDLCRFLKGCDADQPVLWVGLGSNLLVRDGGFNGIVIAYSQALRQLTINENGRVIAGAGVTCARVAKMTARQELSGAEFLAGIPGCMGGALAMNAGAFGSETWNVVTAVTTVNRNGNVADLPASAFRVGYRDVQLPQDTWFVAAELQLQRHTGNSGADSIKTLLDKRAQTQPIGLHSCGSVFRNPPGDHAARLIEACGLKGKTHGGACISDKHANFIINRGDASAADIEHLIGVAQAAVSEKFGITLVPEARIVGEASGRNQVTGDKQS